MSNTSIAVSESKTPTIQELYLNPEISLAQDQVNVILNQPPPDSWLKKHPIIAGYTYLPIDKVEFLLKKLFKKYRIEILREGVSFNGVYVVVRVHYMDIISGEMEYHDGIGAKELQTAKGKSAADLANINSGALSMAYPIAKTIAIKDACDHFGNIFGANTNRKDTMSFGPDTKLESVVLSSEEKRVSKLIEKAKDRATLETLKTHLTEQLQNSYNQKWNELT